ncbi:MAG: threonine synthase [Christensenellaceae bacterium]|jgi:threonine synthase|nr:threonine synthase [Christensenellaceae bacterium]
MLYQSTRDRRVHIPSASAILRGLAPDGGLFVPDEFPQIPLSAIAEMAKLPYHRRAEAVLAPLLDDYSAEELAAATGAAYAPARFGENPAPLKELNGLAVLELWHGPTHAFKDMALQILPRLLALAMKKTGTDKTIQILVATSGDTGKAALEGFKDVEGTAVLVFFPKEGVSPAQKLQMLTQEGGNLRVCAVEGNFDDAQTGVKRIFADEALARELSAKGVELSSANSINFGRLAPQIAYYFSAYADLLAQGRLSLGQRMNVCVPTGNFGNILAAYYARRMGLPVGRMVCASNRNNILFDFIQTGLYDTNREFYKTSSPSMDILVSSNLERLLYELSGRDDALIRSLMAELGQKGAYALPEGMREKLREDFSAGWVSDAQAAAAIKNCFDESGYLMDPHTAVGFVAAREYQRASGDQSPMVLLSTASPYKFSRDVLVALKDAEFARNLDEFACADALQEISGLQMPQSLAELKTKPILHTALTDSAGMRAVVSP